MNKLIEEKEFLIALRNAIANMNLEEDTNINIDDINIEEVKEKIIKLGGNINEMGGVYNRRNLKILNIILLISLKFLLRKIKKT